MSGLALADAFDHDSVTDGRESDSASRTCDANDAFLCQWTEKLFDENITSYLDWSRESFALILDISNSIIEAGLPPVGVHSACIYVLTLHCKFLFCNFSIL